MAIFSLRVDDLSNWERENPLLEDGEMVIVRDAKHYRIGDGFHRFNELDSFGHGMTAYEIAVLHGQFRGSLADFALQFNNFNRHGEQQGGTFLNNGAGWNAFHFPEEFGEMVFITTNLENVPGNVALKNVSKTGFHYCVFDTDGKTVSENVTIHYNAVTMSNQNLARSMAKMIGLNPFNFESLEQLFSENVNEVIADPDAVNVARRSSMVAAKFLCHLSGLDMYAYHNVFSIAVDPSALNVVMANEEAVLFFRQSQAAYDAIRNSEAAMTKYILSLAGVDPVSYVDWASIENFFPTIAGKKFSIEALGGSAFAMAGVLQFPSVIPQMLDSVTVMTVFATLPVAISSIINDPTALSCLALHATAMAVVADSATAMVVVADSATAMVVVADSATAMAAIRGHRTALNFCVNSPIAVSAISKHPELMIEIIEDNDILDIIFSSEECAIHLAKNKDIIEYILSDSDKTEIFFNSNVVGVGLATYINSSNQELLGLKDINQVAGSAGALQKIFLSPTATGHTALMAAFAVRYDTLKVTLNNSTYFVVQLNAAHTTMANINTPLEIKTPNAVMFLESYKMNNYGGTAIDTTAEIKSCDSGNILTTWQPGLGNSTKEFKVIAPGGVNITATGQHQGKIHYGTYTYHVFTPKNN